MDDIAPRRHSIVFLHEVFFSLNLAYAFGYTFIIHLAENQILFTPSSDSGYLFRRSTVRVNDFLHLKLGQALESVLRHPNPGSSIGGEITFCLSVVAAAVLLFFLLRLTAGTFMYRTILSPVAGLFDILAVPAGYLYVLKSTWHLNEFLPPPSTSFWHSPLLAIFGAELLCISILICVYRTRPLSLWVIGFLIVLHYGFWVVVLWPYIPTYVQRLFAPNFLLFVSPLSGVVWLVYLKSSQSRFTKTHIGAMVGWRASAAGAVALVVLAVLWLPTPGYSLAHAKDMNSLTIEMSRTSCFGMCPIYTITVHGNGLVEYVGRANVKIRGFQTGTISSDQIGKLLEILDRAHFFSLEDRAFNWCLDTPSVSVSVAVDGRSKRVISDAACSGAKLGIQAQFVHAADEIDVVVNSAQWVLCDGHRCR